MNTDIKNQWLAALRSGEYVQAKEMLKSKGGFCCLGVLCEIAVHDGVINPKGAGYAAKDRWGEEYVEYSVLPKEVMNWAGLDSMNPMVELVNEPFRLKLSELNDEKNWTFREIADIIEEQL